MIDFRLIGNAVLGAGLTSGAGFVGAVAGEIMAPGGGLSTALGLVAAVAAFAGWVDKRIEARLAERDKVLEAQAKARDEALLRKVEEMMER